MTVNKPKLAVAMANSELTPAGTSVYSRIQGADAVTTALGLLLLAGAAHIVLGSNPIVPAIAILTMALALWPILRYGAMNISVVLLVLIAIRYVGFPLFAKLTMGQALDSNLDQPVTAFTAVLLGVIGYLGAVLLANRISLGKPLLTAVVDPDVLRRVSIIAFLFGFVANVDMSLNAYVEFEALTISFFFAQTLHLALVAAVAAVILETNGRRFMDSWSVAIFVTEVVFAFAINVRTPILEAFLCLVITLVAFRGRLSKKLIAAGISTFLIVVLLSPILLHVRATRGDLTSYERIGATVDAVLNWDVAQATVNESLDAEALSSGYFMRYYGIPNAVLERFSHVNDVDVLISGTDNNRPFGFEVLDQSVERALPRFILPTKPRDYGEGDWIYCELGIKCSYGGFLTAALIGVSYAAFGWLGVIALPFLLTLPLLLLIKKAIGFNFLGNVWAVFLLVAINNQIAEGGASIYVATLFRMLPQYIVMMLVIAILAGGSRVGLAKFK